ncbi:MAG: uridine kinase [Clostridia bacterium]|nr:uridine kinase [Clostridia bacterium]
MNDCNLKIIVSALEECLSNNGHTLLAIDGRCGGGKTYLSGCLESIFECNIVHMDDFFLPFELRNEERMSQIGGNIHKERFLEEVLQPLVNNERVSYRPYECKSGTFSDEISFVPGKLTVIEGTYSCMSEFSDYYDLKIFVDVSDEVRKDRLKRRCKSGEYERFTNIWIPREEAYFDKYNVMSRCDYIIDTSDFDKEI